MACACRCNCKPYDLGVFSCSECILLPFKADQDGVWKIKAEWRDKTWIIPAALAVDEWLKFPNYFNEDSGVIVQIIKPDLTIFALEIYKNEVLQNTYCQFLITVKEIFEYPQEAVAAQELCGSLFDEEGALKLVCKTF